MLQFVIIKSKGFPFTDSRTLTDGACIGAVEP